MAVWDLIIRLLFILHMMHSRYVRDKRNDRNCFFFCAYWSNVRFNTEVYAGYEKIL